MGNCQSSASSVNGGEKGTSRRRINYIHNHPGNEQRWSQLYFNYKDQIVDPEDIHTVLDATLSKTISNLRPAEMTLILRRVRKVVRTIMNSTGNGKASKRVVGELNSKINGSSHHNLSEADITMRSKLIYQKEHLLDGYALRQIFIAGDRLLIKGSREGWAKKSFEQFVRSGGAIDVDDKEFGGDGVDADRSKPPRSPQHHGNGNGKSEKHKNKNRISEDQSNGFAIGNGNGHKGTNDVVYNLNGSGAAAKGGNGSSGTHKNSHGDPRRHNKKSAGGSSSTVIDIIGSAYTLLLYLSENRWDHVSAIAKISAEKAGLVLDVNRQTLEAEEKKKRMHASTPDRKKHASTPSSPERKRHTPSPTKKAKSQPPPAPSTHLYDDHEKYISPPHTPNGTSFQSLSYLIALVLRSDRKQRLVILFHLLLNPEHLKDILDNDPGGGVPSWIMEIDEDWILSYASLGHYYYDDNGPRVDAMSVIETIAILLHYTPSPSPGDNTHNINTNLMGGGGATTTNRETINPKGEPLNIRNRARALSYGDTKYHAAKMHVMLAEYLYQVRQGKDAPIFENEIEQEWRMDLLKVFWKASHPYYRSNDDIGNVNGKQNHSNWNHGQSRQPTWTMDEFISWADAALPDDGALDVIMHQIFGVGLLPTPAMERKLVADSWVEWQVKEMHIFNNAESDYTEAFSLMTTGFMNLLSFSSSRDTTDVSYSSQSNTTADDFDGLNGSTVWGGIGGFDGRGGLGNGIMYCVDKKWWDQWTTYVGWNWNDDADVSYSRTLRHRPFELSSEKLLDRCSEFFVGGTLGSYELMKNDLKKDSDYVLLPPGVWDILYELYAGGPPLPRMIVKKTSGKMAQETSIDVSIREGLSIPNRIPSSLNVMIHPWVLDCHVCDPHQPYRRGDAGPMSIRLMTSAEQPLWRLFAEIVLRLPIVHPRGKDSDGNGRGRLWKKITDEEVDGNAGPSSYGPWRLLQKRGAAVFPVGENIDIDKGNYDSFVSSWSQYADDATVGSVGLQDESRIMFEYALVGKDSKFSWPREAAAKAGLVHLDNREDIAFRRNLRGLDAEGNATVDVKKILGTVIDAMDSAGRWYQAEIADINRTNKSDDSTVNSEDIDEEKEDEDLFPGEIRAVKIDFRDVGGHEEWILVGSDRLAVKGRFTEDSMKSLRLEQFDNNSNGKQSNGETKSLAVVLRRHTSKDPPAFQLSSSVCSFPGFGACGLTNLGNTCYMNSALQCMSYMPILRSYLLSGQFKKYGDLNKDNPLGTGGKLLEEMASLQSLMWSGKFGVRQPVRFRGSLGRAKQQYAAADQQDAQELLNDLIDSLHEDSNKVVKKPYVEGLEDAWVNENSLCRVGEESWRRFLRRNRSIVANIGMGQVLNRVTCPICEYTSRSFDPFNMLSLPFPTVSDVVFRCLVLRRATHVNCSGTLNLTTDLSSWQKKSIPSTCKDHILEEYTITMSRLADISELKQKLQKACGISLNQLRLFVINREDSEDVDDDEDTEDFSIKRLNALPDKEGPCLEYARHGASGEFVSPSEIPTTILAFESTLRNRPSMVDTDVKEDRLDGTNSRQPDGKIGDRSLIRESVQKELKYYGDSDECRLYDSDPTYIAKATSQYLWPQSASDLRLSLRVDAIDQRGNRFPGSVVGFSINHSDPGATKVKVHFDNFSDKWDLTYTFNDFKKGNILPLYSRCRPKDRPLEFQVFHIHAVETDCSSHPFFLQCHTEWSVARAGAQILAQAARFLEHPPATTSASKDVEMLKVYRHHRMAIANAIDVLVAADREYVNAILSEQDSLTTLNEKFMKNIAFCMKQLPFHLSICDTNQVPEGEEKTDASFEFRLDRAIGNYLNARNGVVMNWNTVGTVRPKTLFAEPPSVQDPHGENLSSGKMKGGAKRRKARPKCAHGGMRLDVLLDEFCKEQNLEETDCWRCPKCKDVREGCQSMMLWRLPDMLTFHLKRFNCSARWREKITTKINFPLTGLDMKEWFDEDSPCSSEEGAIYDLVGVVNHYGGMTGGHYVANCKVTACSPDGSEEVEHNFNGAGVHAFGTKEKVTQPGTWKLGRSKEKENSSIHTRVASSAAKTAAESSEPLWLQFDDDSVEPIPPRNVNSESAYVLFYRRRRISPYNIARYSTLD